MNPFETQCWAKHGGWVVGAIAVFLFVGFIFMAREYNEEQQYKPPPVSWEELQAQQELERWGPNPEERKAACMQAYNRVIEQSNQRYQQGQPMTAEEFDKALEQTPCPRSLIDIWKTNPWALMEAP